jgi:ferrous iron transport protein A
VDTVHDSIPLSLMSAGEVANIAEILGLPEQVHRLQELGLHRGVLIEMVQPGSPCIIRFGGQKLCFRGDEMTSVLVRVGAAA